MANTYKGINIQLCYILQCNSGGLYKYRFAIGEKEYCAKDIDDAKQQIDLIL